MRNVYAIGVDGYFHSRRRSVAGPVRSTFARTVLRLFVFLVTMCFARFPVSAQVLTPDFEVRLVPNVGALWQTITLENTYSDAVVICTYNLPSSASPSATTRIRNVGATSFQLRIQQYENSSTVTASDVHCLIADVGAYTLASGVKFEARKVVSDRTSGLSVPNTWSLTNLEEVTSSLTQSYTSPVVIGQVMTFNDAKASVFWTNNCVTRSRTPFHVTNRICVGKHIGQINSTRLDETIGYIVADTGSGTQNDVRYALALGADSVTGVGNSPPYNYTLSGDFDIGVTSQNAEDGGQGGWSVLYGADPLPNNRIQNAIEEEVVAGDTSRTHTTEQISYWVFEDNQTVDIKAKKSVAISPVSVSPYAIPGSDVIYTISAENSGSRDADADTIFIADRLPDDVIFYNGDIDGPGGPETAAVAFSSSGSGLSFNPASSLDLKYSDGAAQPADMGDCNYTPSLGYDPDVSFVCINPKGEFEDGSFTGSSFSFSFRVAVE